MDATLTRQSVPLRARLHWHWILLLTPLMTPASLPAQDVGIVSLAAASNADGRPEIFAIGADGNLYHRWRLSLATPDWSEWTLNANGRFSQVIARRSATGRLYLFGLDAGQLVIRAQSGPNGGWLEESFRTGTDLRALAVASGRDGGFQVAAIGGDGALWTMAGLDDPPPNAEGWSGWSSQGGQELTKIVAERDGEGRVVVVALGADHRPRTIRQLSALEPDAWTDWTPLGEEEVADLALARDEDRTLWLIESGKRSGLYARSLAATLPAAEVPDPRALPPPPRRNPRADVPPQSPDPRAERPGGERGRDRQLTEVPTSPPPDAWSPLTPIVDRALYAIPQLTVMRDESGQLTVFGILTDFRSGKPTNEVLRVAREQSGTWPTDGEPLPLDPERISEFATVAVTSGRGGAEAVFVTDRRSGVAWALVRQGEEEWSTRTWVRLGKIPGAQDPDLLLQVRACLEGVPGIEDPATLRSDIAAGIASNLKGAVRGTPIDGLVGSPQGVSRCVPSGEVMALWLDHEVYGPAIAAANIYPRDDASVFAVLIPEATLRKAFDEVWRVLPKRMGWNGEVRGEREITLHAYDLSLQAPDRLILSIKGSALSLDFTVRATATFGVTDERPWCNADVDIDTPDHVIGGGLWVALSFFMAGPFNAIQDAVASAAEGRIGRQARLVCALSQAFLTELYLPLPEDGGSPQLLEIPYHRVVVVEQGDNAGILGYGQSLPTVRDRRPRVALKVAPSGAPVGRDRVQVVFTVEVADLKPPIASVEWLPSNPKATRLLTPDTLWRANTALRAVFEYEVEPSSVARLYDLGAMTVTVTGADGLAMDVTEGVSGVLRPAPAPPR